MQKKPRNIGRLHQRRGSFFWIDFVTWFNRNDMISWIFHGRYLHRNSLITRLKALWSSSRGETPPPEANFIRPRDPHFCASQCLRDLSEGSLVVSGHFGRGELAEGTPGRPSPKPWISTGRSPENPIDSSTSLKRWKSQSSFWWISKHKGAFS